jgi:hypothetical protein
MAARDDALMILREFGLESLIDNLDKAITDDPDQFRGAFAEEAVFRAVRETDVYKQRFKGLELRKQNGYRPISEREYLQNELAYLERLRVNGMPKGFYDTEDDFARFIGNDIRPDELNTRIESGFRAVAEAEVGTKEELRRLYGVNDSDLAAFFLDPARSQTELVRKAEAARRANAAREQQLQISAQQAEELVNRGVSQSAARQTFQDIAQQEQLYRPQMAGEDVIGQEEAIAAAFGTSASAAQRVATRRRRRQAEFEAGGGFAAGQTGVAGLRSAGE